MKRNIFLTTVKCSNCGKPIHNVLAKKIKGVVYLRAPAPNDSDYLTIMSISGKCGVIHYDCPQT